MKKNISIIDIGSGNLHSVLKAFKYLGANADVTKDISVIEQSDAVVLPGVGAFGAVMRSIRGNNLDNVIIRQAKSTKPFLGICVGMQVLFGDSEESPGIGGLRIFKGKVVKFKKAKKVPHTGWNETSSQWSVVSGQWFYFVHSYYVLPQNKSIIYGETEYDDEKFTSVIRNDNLIAVQFHPEKSGDAGLNFLKSFI